MSTPKRARAYRFPAFWASAMVILGMLLVGTGLLAAVLALTLEMPWGRVTGQAVLERTLAAAVLAASGAFAGGPFIALGVMMRLLLDQRNLLARLARRRRLRQRPGPDRRVI